MKSLCQAPVLFIKLLFVFDVVEEVFVRVVGLFVKLTVAAADDDALYAGFLDLVEVNRALVLGDIQEMLVS